MPGLIERACHWMRLNSEDAYNQMYAGFESDAGADYQIRSISIPEVESSKLDVELTDDFTFPGIPPHLIDGYPGWPANNCLAIIQSVKCDQCVTSVVLRLEWVFSRNEIPKSLRLGKAGENK